MLGDAMLSNSFPICLWFPLTKDISVNTNTILPMSFVAVPAVNSSLCALDSHGDLNRQYQP